MLNLFSTNIDIQSFITSSRDLRFVYNSVASLSASMMKKLKEENLVKGARYDA